MLGRLFPQRNSNRSFPYDPQTNGDTDRIAPLPFQNVGNTIYSLYLVFHSLLTKLTQISTEGGVIVSVGCSQIADMYCVPTATITMSPAPVAAIRCSIT